MFLVFTKKKWFIKALLLVMFLITLVLSFSISYNVTSSFGIRQLFSKVDYQIREIGSVGDKSFCIYESPNHYYEIDVYDSILGLTFYSSNQFDFDYFTSDENVVLYVFSYVEGDSTYLLIYLPSNLEIDELKLYDQTITKTEDYFFFETSDSLDSQTTFTIGEIIYHLP
ncbi:MAG: hypothetical protein AB7U79_08895 [Candidatus Izemoplasmatales bacterium]